MELGRGLAGVTAQAFSFETERNHEIHKAGMVYVKASPGLWDGVPPVHTERPRNEGLWTMEA